MNKPQVELNQIMIDFFETIDINTYYGCSGGGVLQLLKLIPPYHQEAQGPRFVYLSEYAAGYAPIGHYLASGEVACCIATTGAAEKLISSGASDARYLGVPALYLCALASEQNTHRYPIQDIGPQGMQIIEQFRCEFKENVVYIQHDTGIQDAMVKIQEGLQQKQPVIVFFHPELLNKKASAMPYPHQTSKHKIDKEGINKLIDALLSPQKHHIIVNPCTEVMTSGVNRETFRSFIDKINAQVIYPVNGDNIAVNTTEQNLGHIMLGGNPSAIHAWNNLSENDILITLGADPGEYHLNLAPYPKCQSFCLTQHTNGYGQMQGSYKHLFAGKYTQINGNIEVSLQQFMTETQTINFPEKNQFANHHDRAFTNQVIADGKVNIIDFYETMDKLWQPNSLVFEDVCIAYRDRQSIIKQPNKQVKMFTANQGSAMGSAFGLGFGAALADPNQRVFVFSGDGCFRLYGGNLMEANQLNMTLFIMNNSELSIIRDGCNHILKNSPQKIDHADIRDIHWERLATAFGWRFFRISPDLSNLEHAMITAYDSNPTSTLIELPLDGSQVIGKNFRYTNLTNHGNI